MSSAVFRHSVIFVMIHNILEIGGIIPDTDQYAKAFIPKHSYGSFIFVSSADDTFEFQVDVRGIFAKKSFSLFDFTDIYAFGDLFPASFIFDIELNLHGDALK